MPINPTAKSWLGEFERVLRQVMGNDYEAVTVSSGFELFCVERVLNFRQSKVVI
jgi:hypothetical protein